MGKTLTIVVVLALGYFLGLKFPGIGARLGLA